MSRRKISGLLTAAIMAGLMALPASASATLTCTNPAGALTLTKTVGGIDDVTVRVNGTAIELLDDGALIACPGAPTTLNTVSFTFNHDAGISDLFFEEPDRLAPGTGGPAEGAGLAEIEIALNENGGILSTVQLRDDDGAGDRYVFGANGVNLNAPEAGGADVDLVLTSFFTELIPVGGASADVFDARGGGGTGAVFSERFDAVGNGGSDQLFGGDEFDAMQGGPDNDLLDAGPGFDRLDGGTGDDTLIGGADDDEIDYRASTLPVSIDLAAGGPQDAGSFGRDTIVGVERLIGSLFNDVLRGSAGEDELDGNGGDDLLDGRGEDDDLDGGGGFDTASYEAAPVGVNVNLGDDATQNTVGAGMDRFDGASLEAVIGSPGNDLLIGSSGMNRFDGRGGSDTIRALGGDDTVAARDGVKDTVDCGTGTDSGVFDAPGVDAVTGCESSAFRDISVRFLVTGKRQKIKKGGVAIALRCPDEDCTSRVTASVKVGKRTLRFKTVTLKQPGGQRLVIVLKLSKRNLARVRRALKARKKLTVRLRITVEDAAGNTATRTLSFRLRR